MSASDTQGDFGADAAPISVCSSWVGLLYTPYGMVVKGAG